VGGIFGGSYPIFIKVPQVIAAKVNPIVFQCYKSFWVFALAWIFLLVNALRQKPLFLFTYWGVVGASFWVPAGFAYIAAVGMCGVATATVLNTGVNTVIQFVASIMTKMTMKTYGASQVPLAPFYLAALILGMMGLILSPTLSLSRVQKAKDDQEIPSQSTMSFVAEGDSLLSVKPATPNSQRRFVVGVLLAATSGTFGGLKFAVTSFGPDIAKRYQPDDVVKSEFAVFESYMMSFGIGCAVSTTALFIIFALLQKGVCRQELPSAEFPVMKLYGFLAGFLWMCSYMCLQGANNVGGGGSFGPAGNASQLITAGLWGLFYYREIKDPKRVACWVLSAAGVMVFVVLLTGELKKKEEEESLMFL
jgi:glucose uptake protein GlcU